MPRGDGIMPDLPLSRPAFDRRGDLRTDPTLLPRLLSDPGTAVLRLVGDRVRVEEASGGGLRACLGPPSEQDRGRLAFYLGEAGGTAHVGVVVDEPAASGATDPGASGAADPAASGTTDPALRTLRQAGADLDDVGAAAFCTTLALANWHRTHSHCPRCGAPTAPDLAGWIRRCPHDDSEHYPRTDMAVIVAVVDDDDRILLARGRGFRTKGMSVLAGFVEPGETLAGAVAREVAEEVGVRVRDVTYLGDQPWPFPSSLMLGFTARAADTELVLQEDEIEAARWFTRAELTEAVADGSVLVSGRISISRRLIERWYGGPLDPPAAP